MLRFLPASRDERRLIGHPVHTAALIALAGLLLAAVGCESEPIDPGPSAPPGPTYTGAKYLRGTIGSLTRVRNNHAIPVAGYGLVVGLNGTGSSEAPAGLRNWLINEMKKGGFGSARLGTLYLNPSKAIADQNTAVVAVQGFIPAGATPGTRFDVLVSSLPGTQTTSLAGGRLFTSQMALNGLRMASDYSKPLARANGPMYQNPFDNETAKEESKEFRRQAVIIGGGKVTEPRRIELVLNQPSYSRARAITDRINERFAMGPDDRLHETADPKSDARILIHVPKRFSSRPQRMLGLINHLFIQRSPQFQPRQTRELFDRLKAHPENREDVILALKALGKTITPVLRQYYEHPRMRLRLAALRVGAYAEDGRAAGHLLKLAHHKDAAIREQVAQALVHLPRSIDATRALKQLLDDPVTDVRLAAYESLADNNDPIIQRMAVRGGDEFKFAIDRVPSDRPLVFITQQDFPRLVLFGPQLGFKPSLFANLWGNRLILRKPKTLPQALAGVEEGKTAYVPVFSRAKIRELDARWNSRIRDGQGNEAQLQIDSRSLRDRFEKLVKPRGEKDQTLAIVRLIEREQDPKSPADRYRLRLIGFRSVKKPRPVTVYYQGPDQIKGQTYKITPKVATLAFMLAHEPSDARPQKGLDLTYSEVVDAVYHLCKQQAIPADVQIASSPLASIINRYDQLEAASPQRRPETSKKPASQ